MSPRTGLPRQRGCWRDSRQRHAFWPNGPDLGVEIRTYAVDRDVIVYRGGADHVLVIRYYHGARNPDRMV